ncbi:MAG: FHA domain-containing protein [bacterium]|nr:FHA domain-containing protein [bacterium]
MVTYTLQRLQQNSPTIAFAPSEAAGYVAGRADEATNYLPDIDLSAFDARECGVSRRHCAFVLFRGSLHVVDLGSINGTFVNGMRLAPEVPCAVYSGNHMRLGTLELLILSQTA